MTIDEMKAGLVQQIKDWLDNPGNVTTFAIETHVVPHPQTGAPFRFFTVKHEQTICQAQMPVETPRIVQANGPLPPPPGSPPRGNQH